MDDRSEKNPETEYLLLPKNINELVEYIVKAASGFTTSTAYEVDLDGDYHKYLDQPVTACASFGRYIREMVDSIIADPKRISDIRPNILQALNVLETIGNIDNDEIIDSLMTGTFETIESAKDDVSFSTIVGNLGPHSRMLWDQHIPYISTREPKLEECIKI